MYVHLLSNASMDVFPNNTLSDFSTILHHPLILEADEWDVGLVEINIPNNVDTITKDEAWIKLVTYEETQAELVYIASDVNNNQLAEYECRIDYVHKENHYEVELANGYMLTLSPNECGLPEKIYGDSNRVYIGKEIASYVKLGANLQLYRVPFKSDTYRFQGGYYENLSTLANVINKAVSDNRLSLSIHENLDIAQCHLGENSNVIHFSNLVSNVYGFRNQSVHGKETIARHATDPFSGFNCILVFTNFIQEQFVGDEKAPLLRLLPLRTTAKRNEVMSYSCLPIQYKRVMQKEIVNICIVLTDDVGRQLSFGDRGRVSLMLHFKRRHHHQHGTLHTN